MLLLFANAIQLNYLNMLCFSQVSKLCLMLKLAGLLLSLLVLDMVLGKLLGVFVLGMKLDQIRMVITDMDTNRGSFFLGFGVGYG